MRVYYEREKGASTQPNERRTPNWIQQSGISAILPIAKTLMAGNEQHNWYACDQAAVWHRDSEPSWGWRRKAVVLEDVREAAVWFTTSLMGERGGSGTRGLSPNAGAEAQERGPRVVDFIIIKRRLLLCRLTGERTWGDSNMTRICWYLWWALNKQRNRFYILVSRYMYMLYI